MKPTAVPLVPLVALLALATVLAGCSTPDLLPAPTLPPPVTAQPQNFTWEAGAFTGSLAVQVHLEGHGSCGVSALGRGIETQPGSPLLVAVEDSQGLHAETNGGQSSLETYAGADAVVVGRNVSSGYPRAWATSVGEPVMLDGSANVTFAAAWLAADPAGPPSWANPQLANSTFVLHVDCKVPVKWSFSGSRNVVAFDEASMGGAGLSVDAAFEPATARAAGHAELEVAEPQGRVILVATGDVLTNRGEAGVVTVTTPAGQDQWVLRPHQLLAEGEAGIGEGDARAYGAGPGHYTVDLTYASPPLAGIFSGMMFGLAPLETLDPLVA